MMVTSHKPSHKFTLLKGPHSKKTTEETSLAGKQSTEVPKKETAALEEKKEEEMNEATEPAEQKKEEEKKERESDLSLLPKRPEVDEEVVVATALTDKKTDTLADMISAPSTKKEEEPLSLSLLSAEEKEVTAGVSATEMMRSPLDTKIDSKAEEEIEITLPVISQSPSSQ
jgi:hypothetical protein